MAEQNILNANQAVLEQILGDINEHEENQEMLEHMSFSIREISKEIDSVERSMEDEISSRIKESTDSIVAGYEKAIASDKEKIKQVQIERDKAKMQGIKERIDSETAALRNENKELKSQIEKAFIQQNVPAITNNSFFMTLFISRKLKDILIYALFLLVVFVCIPAVLFYLSVVPAWSIILYMAILAILFLVIGKLIYINVILPHNDVIIAARDTKYRINNNKKVIKKIQHSIRKDKDEAMYGLESFDHKINDLHDSINRTESEKQKALKEFEDTVKPDIVKEIESRYADKLDLMKTELAKKKEEHTKLEDLIKQQRIYISSNYEAYLGKEFVDKDKLAELNDIMMSEGCETIAQAIAIYKNHR